MLDYEKEKQREREKKFEFTRLNVNEWRQTPRWFCYSGLSHAWSQFWFLRGKENGRRFFKGCLTLLCFCAEGGKMFNMDYLRSLRCLKQNHHPTFLLVLYQYHCSRNCFISCLHCNGSSLFSYSFCKNTYLCILRKLCAPVLQSEAHLI